MIGRLLCLLGLHNWDWQWTNYEADKGYEYCAECGRRKKK